MAQPASGSRVAASAGPSAPDLEAQADPPEAVALFDSAYDSFRQGRASSEPLHRFYRIANHILHLQFAGPALVSQLTPALEHLSIQSDPGSIFAVCLWDGVSTGGSIPNLPWAGRMVTRRGEIRGFTDGRIQAALDRAADTLSLLDRERDMALFCTRDARRLPYYEAAAPLRTILYWWLRERGAYLVHAAAIGTDRGGVLLAGKGGVGKSTTALACLNSGFTYLADDYCVVRPRPAPWAFSVYRTAKITPDARERLAFPKPLAALGDRRVHEKGVLFLDPGMPHKMGYGLPLRAILLPRVTGRAESRWVPASSSAALSALALSTLVQLPGAGRETLEALQQLTEMLPCCQLEVGTDLARIPEAIRDLLTRV